MAAAQSKKFVFNNHADGLYPLVTEVIEYITQKEKIGDDTVSKLKLVLVELLTNSLKHSGGDKTTIEVATKGNQITIKKTDSGKGLTIRCGENLLEWPLPGKHHANRMLIVYTDANAVLKAKLTNNCCLQFFIEETEQTGPLDINALTEHFGLMIITRACQAFVYEFDIHSCTNNFTVSINKT
jgi:two-component sensor histidine kinase